jgi:hypothetical protein
MEVICPSKTSADFQQTMAYVPEDINLHNHQCEYLKSYTNKIITGGIYLKYKMMLKALLLEFLDINPFDIFAVA